MSDEIKLMPRAVKGLESLPKATAHCILVKVEALGDELTGDVKRLTDFTPEYRLRVGDYPISFEVEGSNVVVHRILHRKDTYR